MIRKLFLIVLCMPMSISAIKFKEFEVEMPELDALNKNMAETNKNLRSFYKTAEKYNDTFAHAVHTFDPQVIFFCLCGLAFVIGGLALVNSGNTRKRQWTGGAVAAAGLVITFSSRSLLQGDVKILS